MKELDKKVCFDSGSGSGCQFCVQITCPCPSFGFYFSFHFIPRVLEGTSQKLTWNPIPCHPGHQCRPLIGQGLTMLASDWLRGSAADPLVLRVMLMVSPPYSGILHSATVFKTIWRMLTDKKILDFLIFHGTEESSLAQLRITQEFKIFVRSLYEWIKSRFRQCTMNLKTAQYSQMAYINALQSVLLCGCSEYYIDLM